MFCVFLYIYLCCCIVSVMFSQMTKMTETPRSPPINGAVLILGNGPYLLPKQQET